METTIVKIDGNKIQAVVDNDIKEFELEPWVKPEFVKLGDAELTIKDGKVSFCSMIPPKEEKKDEAKKPESKNWADNITNFESLLKDAHKKFKGKFEIETDILRDSGGNLMIDFEKKRAVFKAIVTADGMTFEGHGETTEENISGDTAKSWMRIAETRAIVRALRWATNNATVAEEEIPEGQKAEPKTEKSQS